MGASQTSLWGSGVRPALGESARDDLHGPACDWGRRRPRFMNASVPKDAEIREAIAAILASHSLDELTFERVYMLLEASFVVPLSSKRDQIKKQLEILLFKVFVDYAASSSPGKTYPSPERPKGKEAHRQPIKKLLQHRLSQINKKRSTDLAGVIESVISTGDPRFSAEAVFRGEAPSIWMSTGLYPQVLHVRFACPVCLEKLALESTSIQRLRIECQRVPKGPGAPRGAGVSSPSEKGSVWGDDVVAIEKVFEDPDGWRGGVEDGGTWEDAPPKVQASEIGVNFAFTQLLLITIVEGFRDFCSLRKVSLYGIKLDLLSE